MHLHTEYDVTSLSLIAKDKLTLLCVKHPPTAWALATLYHLPDVAEIAMRNFDNISVAAPKFNYTHKVSGPFDTQKWPAGER